MTITKIKCDKCGDICEGDYMTVYRNSGNRIIGKSDICEVCYAIMCDALEKELKG
jgi:hypothetical protein